MNLAIAVLTLAVGLALVVIAVMGTQNQVFSALTLRNAPGTSTTAATAPGGPVTSSGIV